MKREDFLRMLDELLELPSGTLTGPERLADLEGWTSLAVLGFLALADERCGVTVAARQVLNCQTVNGLLSLAGVPE